MKKSYFKRMFLGTIVFLLLSSVFGLSAPATGTTLTGLIELSIFPTATGSPGAPSGESGYNTLGSDGVFNLYVRSGDIASGGSLGPFLNSGNGPGASISIPLVTGANTFTLFGDGGAGRISSLNLFFNGDNNNAPGISVFAPVAISPSPPFPSFAENAATTLKLDISNIVPGAGTLVFIDGTTTVTLTDYSWSLPSVFNTNQVSGFEITPNFTGAGTPLNDSIGRLTLTVSGPAGIVPEPSTWLLLGSGLVALGLIRRRSSWRMRTRSFATI